MVTYVWNFFLSFTQILICYSSYTKIFLSSSLIIFKIKISDVFRNFGMLLHIVMHLLFIIAYVIYIMLLTVSINFYALQFLSDLLIVVRIGKSLISTIL